MLYYKYRKEIKKNVRNLIGRGTPGFSVYENYDLIGKIGNHEERVPIH